MSFPAPFSRLDSSLVALVLWGLLGALFAPDGRWQGLVDIGAVGAAIYALGLAALVWRVALLSERVCPANWSIAERRGWSALFFGVLILLSFTHFLWSEARSSMPPMALHEFMFRRFGWNLGVLGVSASVVHRLLGARGADIPELDERDLRIRHAADRAGNGLLTAIVILCVGLLVALPYDSLAWWLAPLIAAHVLIGVLICKSLAENVWIVAAYARERR
jgi:hypothetical protein